MTETASGARKLRSTIMIDLSSDEEDNMQTATTTFPRRGGARDEKPQIPTPAQQASSNMTNESSRSRRMTRNTNMNQSKNVDEDSNLLCSENLDGEESPSPTPDFPEEEEPAPKKPRIDLSLAKILRPARSVVGSKKSSRNKNGSDPATKEKSPKAAAAKPPAPQPSRTSTRPSRREQKTAVSDSTAAQDSPVSPAEKSSGEIVTKYIALPALSARCPPLPKLDSNQVRNLEEALQLDSSDPDGGWREDWMGNLGFLHKDVPNPTLSKPKRKSGAATLPFWEWGLGSTTGAACTKLVHHLLMYVYHLKNTPQMAKSILAHSVSNEADIVSTVNAVARISYDPVVLQQDGWTTQKESEYQGASGGAYHIGSHVIWQKYEAVVVAYVHDNDMGDLWKAMWLEEHDTFDMEAEELQAALKKYERKKNMRSNSDAALSSTQNSTSSRFASAKNYVVDDIENGIVLAGTYHPQARHGVLWPARVMHVSENISVQPQSKRGSAKNRVTVVFLAPYWNRPFTGGGRRVVESYGENLSQAKSMFDSGPLFEMDTIEVSSDMLQKYPYGGRELKIDQLRDAFRFSGLPKAAFPRFLDSHRLAMALKTYSSTELKAPATTLGDSRAISTLSDTHVMAIQTAMFPLSILHLPFDYILSELPPPTTEHSATLDQGEESVEPVLDLRAMLNSMTPPDCWGLSQSIGGNNQVVSPTKTTSNLNPTYTHDVASPLAIKSNGGSRVDDLEWNLNQFCSEFLLKTLSKGETHLTRLVDDLSMLISQLRDVSLKWEKLDSDSQASKSRLFLNRCMLFKSHGEESINCNFRGEDVLQKLVVEWRKSCERIFKRATIKFSSTEAGNGVTMILTDSRCNEHLTASGCVERVVRLPAAIKASKMAGAGKSRDIQLIFPVEDRFVNMAEKTVLPKAHKASYLKRMKAKCTAIEPGRRGAMLTDDSDGNGGEDTMGSRGSYTAAVAGVAAALQAVDRIASGQCVNAFCATRPPGHHAGRDLHSMKAVSNGFCVLNPAACAALYATTPQSEGGPGFRRVCVIDFDVHHGNGTQDILCNTYDPRFLYVSIHAGGAHINGYDTDDDDSGQNNSQRPGGSSQNAGIYPGRCGDTCPHEGVLNLPLGAKVTAQHVGQVLASKVSPAVDAFAPDLIVLSAGFDAHKNDPLGMGGLSAEDFGSITTVACSMAFRSCSGRVISILEGGYGVPCCRPQRDDLFLPKSSPMEGEAPYTTSQQTHNDQTSASDGSNPSPKDMLATNLLEQQEGSTQKQEKGPQIKLLDLGEDLPENMEDEVPRGLRGKVDRCHTEGFIDCVREHVSSLAKSNTRK